MAAHSANRFIHTWRIDTGECVNRFKIKGVREGVECMAFSHNSELLALGDRNIAKLRLWSTIMSDCLRALEPPPPENYFNDGHPAAKPLEGR